MDWEEGQAAAQVLLEERVGVLERWQERQMTQQAAQTRADIKATQG